jgi:hypothetical protein
MVVRSTQKIAILKFMCVWQLSCVGSIERMLGFLNWRVLNPAEIEVNSAPIGRANNKYSRLHSTGGFSFSVVLLTANNIKMGSS